nr:SET and MYND domain containing protein 4 [Hymenolepis microstoma]
MVAVFLTFCFHIGGYPMKWCNETDLFFELPSARNRPDCIPASWLASCLLYHLQTIDVNSFSVAELTDQEKRKLDSNRVYLGQALHPTLSLINHSCLPSASVLTTTDGYGVLIASQFIPVGGEVTIDYISGSNGSVNRNSQLFKKFYFNCTCAACYTELTLLPERGTFLICPQCRSTYPLARQCPICESTLGYRLSNKIDSEYNDKIRKRVEKMDFDLETFRRFLKDVQSIILPPHKALDLARYFHDFALHYRYGMWTLEPWSQKDFSKDLSNKKIDGAAFHKTHKSNIFVEFGRAHYGCNRYKSSTTRL